MATWTAHCTICVGTDQLQRWQRRCNRRNAVVFGLHSKSLSAVEELDSILLKFAAPCAASELNNCLHNMVWFHGLSAKRRSTLHDMREQFVGNKSRAAQKSLTCSPLLCYYVRKHLLVLKCAGKGEQASKMRSECCSTCPPDALSDKRMNWPAKIAL